MVVSTVRGYMYVCGDVLTVGSQSGCAVCSPVPLHPSKVRKEQVSRLEKLGSERQQCHHQPGSERTKDQPLSLSVASLVFRRPLPMS
jgi:hypothetical protein